MPEGNILGFDIPSLVLFAASIIIGLAIAWFFYQRTKRDLALAADERAKRGREELIGMTEGFIIEGVDVSQASFGRLIAATERELDVVFGNTVTPQTLLEDAALRIQRSRHLTAEQKQTCMALVEHISDALSKAGPSPPAEARVRRPQRRYEEQIVSMVTAALSVATLAAAVLATFPLARIGEVPEWIMLVAAAGLTTATALAAISIQVLRRRQRERRAFEEMDRAMSESIQRTREQLRQMLDQRSEDVE